VAALPDRLRRVAWECRHAPRAWVESLLASAVPPRHPKLAPATTLALVVTSGNRLEYLRESLPTYLAGARPQDRVLLSVYADRQGTADWVRRQHAAELRSGKLTMLETEAPVFNKARALNIAVSRCDADYLLLLDCDCRLWGRRSVARMLQQYNHAACALMSFGFMGQLLVRRDQFLALGGYDSRLRDVWAPDDADFIARHIAYFQRPYRYLHERYLLMIRPSSDGCELLQRDRKHPRWVVHARERDPSQTVEALFDTPYYRRLGSRPLDRNEVLASTVRYFQQHEPRIPFVAKPPSEPAEAPCR
jgi:hypothetical protein